MMRFLTNSTTVMIVNILVGLTILSQKNTDLFVVSVAVGIGIVSLHGWAQGRFNPQGSMFERKKDAQ
jgi:hypothetical protein